MGLLNRLLPAIGTLYLVYLTLQPPPVRWVGLICLAVVTPFVVGWLAGNLLGIGPWAGDDE
jgi:ABC-type transport system involved in cytochrome bd biosynthesis fused ATPase/permease subunit